MHRTGAVFCSRILNECVIYLIHMRKKREAAGMTPERSTEELEYKSAHAQPEEKHPYTPRPKSQIVLAWVLLAVVLFAIGGMCYWQMFGRF